MACISLLQHLPEDGDALPARQAAQLGSDAMLQVTDQACAGRSSITRHQPMPWAKVHLPPPWLRHRLSADESAIDGDLAGVNDPFTLMVAGL
jgi:hypothetical protein